MKYKAYIVESEAGWGSKVDEVKEFDTKDERDAFVKEYNDKHNPPLKRGQSVPSWYMIAEAATP